MRDAKTIVVMGLASVLVVMAVVVDGAPVARDAICTSTDYKELCKKSLSKANSSDPRKLIQAALEYTVDNLATLIKKSDLHKEAAANPKTKNSVDICDEVLNRAISDLKRSFRKIGKLGTSSFGKSLEDLRIWLSAVITYEDTCIDAFAESNTAAGQKVKNLLNTTKELSSNALALATNIKSILGKLDPKTFNVGNINSEARKKLLWYEEYEGRRLADTNNPNAVVALDGSGQFKTINEAINTVPAKNTKPFVILVKAGVYNEYVQIPKKANFIVLLGEGATKTKITGNKNFIDGTKTYESATVGIDGEDFTAKDIGFENSAGPEKHQAVALRVSGDRAIFHNVNVDGYQDSLYAHTYRQFYRGCRISGTVDFVFGNSLSIFQKCNFIVRKPMQSQACMVTAQGRTDARSDSAIVIMGSTIEAEPAFVESKPAIKAYLGRPWKEFSRTIIMFTNIGGFIDPTGWSEWQGNFALNTLYYAEYQNTGPGANQQGRVKWKGIQKFGPNEAQQWTAAKLFNGDLWIKDSGVPYAPDLNMV